MTSLKAARLLLVVSGIGVAMPHTSASAQSLPTESAAPPPTAESGQRLEEVVVTARRTQENLQRIPVAVTAVGAEMIKTLQVTEAADLQRAAPGLVIATGSPSGSGNAYVSIRGHYFPNAGVENDPAVGIYIDGVYIPRPSQGTVDLIDISRAEVIRGPQGTLYGRNTPGGALNITTADPTDKFEAELTAEYGNYDYKTARVVLNAPLAEGLTGRIVYNFSEHTAYGRDPLTGRGVSDRKSHFVRGKLRWAPDGSDWNLTLAADYNRIRDAGQLQALAGYDPSLYGDLLLPFLPDGSNFYATFFNDIDYARNPAPQDEIDAWGGSATINGKIGFLNVKSITAYRYSSLDSGNDLDATPFEILSTDGSFPSRQFSQEFQAFGELGDRFNYILGAYYSRETGRSLSVARAFGFLFPSRPFAADADVVNRSIGLFGQGYYKVTDLIRLTGGLRWTWDKRFVNLHNVNVFGDPSSCNLDTSLPGFSAPCSLPQTAKFNYPAWTVGVDYQPTPDIMMYAKGSAASQAGGLNTRVGALPFYGPARTTEIELGTKTAWFDNRLRFNVALFYEWQRGVQLNKTAFVPAVRGVTQFLTNADARVYGAEFEATALPWRGMLLNGTLSLLRGHFVRGTFLEDQSLPNGAVVVADRSGEAMPQLPKLQFSIGATQTVPVSVGEVSIHVDYAYQSSQVFGQATPAAAQPASVKTLYALANAANQIDGYGLLNGRIGLQLSARDLEIYLFAKNMLSKKYYTRSYGDLFTAGLGLGLAFQGDPRTYGVGARLSF